MPHSASMVVRNRSGTWLGVTFEPPGRSLYMHDGSELRVVAEGEQPGDFDVRMPDNGFMVVSAWRGANVRWFVDGIEHTQPAPWPEGPIIATAAGGDPQPPYVSSIAEDRGHLHVTVHGDVDEDALRALGGRAPGWFGTTWKFPGGGQRAMGLLLRALSDLGIALLGAGPGGWNPGDIYELSRDRGDVTGSYPKIYWLGPGLWEVREA
jgi:hypothetical protein